MQESAYFRFAVIAIWLTLVVAGIFFAYRQWGATVNYLWFVAAGLLCALFIGGIATNPANRRGWPIVLANKQFVYLVDSPDADCFIKISWARVRDCYPGDFSINEQGIRFEIGTQGLSEKEKQILLQSAINNQGNGCIIVAVPAPVSVNRKKNILKLRGFLRR